MLTTRWEPALGYSLWVGTHPYALYICHSDVKVLNIGIIECFQPCMIITTEQVRKLQLRNYKELA